MKLILIILAVVAVAGALSYLAVKMGWLSDRDNDGIADVIEDKYDDIKEDVEDVIEDVKDAVEDKVDAVKEVAKKVTRKKPGRKSK